MPFERKLSRVFFTIAILTVAIVHPKFRRTIWSLLEDQGQWMYISLI